MAKKKEMSYEAAMKQLQEIVDNLENNTLGIDTLSKQLQEAQELIAFCKKRLGEVEEEVKTVLENGKR